MECGAESRLQCCKSGDGAEERLENGDGAKDGEIQKWLAIFIEHTTLHLARQKDKQAIVLNNEKHA